MIPVLIPDDLSMHQHTVLAVPTIQSMVSILLVTPVSLCFVQGRQCTAEQVASLGLTEPLSLNPTITWPLNHVSWQNAVTILWSCCAIFCFCLLLSHHPLILKALLESHSLSLPSPWLFLSLPAPRFFFPNALLQFPSSSLPKLSPTL